MSAELLREAAEKIRVDAIRALVDTPPPWTATPGDEFGCQVRAANGTEVVGFVPHEGGGADQDCIEHIASWHPAVALDGAELLDLLAFYAEGMKDHDPVPVVQPILDEAFEFARAYLGREL